MTARVGVWFILPLLGGCTGSLDLSVDPGSISEVDWREPLRVVGLSPSVYLERDGEHLRVVEPLTVIIGGLSTEVVNVDGQAITVRLVEPIAPGMHSVIVEAKGDSIEASGVLRVVALTDVDSGADGGEPDSGIRDSAPSDSGMSDASPTDAADTSPLDVCGDRVLGPTEDCDDGNTTGGDGCAASCALETMRDACPGNPIVINLGGPQLYRGTIAGASSTVMCRGGIGSGPDRVYEIAPQFTGWINLRLTPVDDFDAALMTRSECPGSTQYYCADDTRSAGIEVIDGSVNRTRRYMVIASSAGPGEEGEFIIRFEGRSTR